MNNSAQRSQPNGAIASRAHKIYEDRIRSVVEPQHHGEFLVIDVESGEYELDPNEVAAFNRASSRHPAGKLFILRVGYPTAHRLGC